MRPTDDRLAAWPGDTQRCPDCDSTVTLVWLDNDSTLLVDVGHDPGCPAWQTRRPPDERAIVTRVT